MSNDISNQMSNFVNNNSVQPLNWVLPDKKEFLNWINETFIKYRADGKPVKSTNTFTPFKYQKFVRDYMQNNSPYNGILLYHSTGSGKSCTSIGIAENLKTERNIVVMLPASLKTNFITKGLQFCGDISYQQNDEAYKEKYSFVSYNANNTIAQIKKIGSLDNKVIIIDEVHNLISKMNSGIMGSSKQGLEIYNILMNAQNSKIIAMSGTPIINNPFEIAILFNILRGFIEITYFSITKVSYTYGNTWDLRDIEKKLMENTLIDFLEINKVNKSIQFHIKVKSYTDAYTEVVQFIQDTCDSYGVSVRYLELKKVTLFPLEDYGNTFNNYFVKEDNKDGDRLKNEEVFKRRIMGLVSYYQISDKTYPTIKANNIYRVEMSKYQLQIYEILRSKERLSERGSSKKAKTGKKQAVKSTFRVFSRQASNFVFPEEINRPYPDPEFIISLIQKNNNNKFGKNTDNKKDKKKMNFNKILNLENNANDGKLSIEYKTRINNAIDNLVENGDIYFKDGPNGLDKLSPKMKMVLDNINKSHGLVFVYSNFRTLEGIELFSRVLDFNGYVRFGQQNGDNDPRKKYAIYSGIEDEKQKRELLQIFTSNENKHGKFIKIILASSAGAEGLDLKNIRQIHILEPYWNQMRIQQIIGRGVRRNSHISLPPNERNVEVFRYFTVFPKLNNVLSTDKITTDEYIEQISWKKQVIINELLQILKECSIDCVLNSADTKPTYKCFSFGKGAKGIAYHPDILKDIIESHVIENKKIVQRKLTKAVYYDKKIYLIDSQKKQPFYLYTNNTKTSVNLTLDKDKSKPKPVYVDINTNEVFQIKSIDNTMPKLLGYVNDKGILVSKK